MITREQYYELHKLCPKCLSDNFCVTTKGVIFIEGQEYVDTNRCNCKCGWVGQMHDTISDKMIGEIEYEVKIKYTNSDIVIMKIEHIQKKPTMELTADPNRQILHCNPSFSSYFSYNFNITFEEIVITERRI